MSEGHKYFDDNFLDLSDEETWKIFRQGNKRAFEHLFKRFNPILFHFGVKFFSDQDVVEDCIQELFLKLWKTRGELPPVVNVKYYLITALRRSLLRSIMTNKRQLDLKGVMAIIQRNDQAVPSHEHYIIAQQLANQATDELTVAINELPARQKQAVYLRFYEEKSYEEITSIMKINYQTARKFIYKALQSIRKSIGVGSFSKE